MNKCAAALAVAGFLSAAGLSAAPRLRLVSSTVGPVSIAQGSNGAAQSVEAYNLGDGSLNLVLSSSVPWIVPSSGSPFSGTERACSSRPGICTPLYFVLTTSGLAVGTFTGVLTVSDPTAVDAPQTISVTVQIGGGVPASLDVYAAPGVTRDITFTTNSQLGATVKTNDGGAWLSVALDGTGSFRFAYPYRIHFAPSAGMAEGTYTGRITTAGSTFAPDNKTIPVTMRVTTQPIAQASTNRLRVRLAQGAPAYTTAITFTNLGQGALQVHNTATSGAAWITATPYAGGGLIPDGISVSVNAGTLTPGIYTDGILFSTNAVYDGIPTEPMIRVVLNMSVELEIVAAGPPVVDFQGVQDNATFVPGDAVAPGDIAVVKGQQLSTRSFVQAWAPPIPTQLSDTQVLFNGQPLPLYYTLYGQIACQIPSDAPIGTSLVQVKRQDGQVSNQVSVDIAARAPRILVGPAGYGVITNQDGSRPMPNGSWPGVPTHPAKTGDTLTLWAIGLGATNPYVATGQPAPSSEPLARLTSAPVVAFGGGIGGVTAAPLFAGLSPTYAGLYQVNVTIPDSAPRGNVYVSLAFGNSTSNSVLIYVQ
jgi:uncharacterized protein (TIGR03437 family)